MIDFVWIVPGMNDIETKEGRHANMTAIALRFYKVGTPGSSVERHNLTSDIYKYSQETTRCPDQKEVRVKRTARRARMVRASRTGQVSSSIIVLVTWMTADTYNRPCRCSQRLYQVREGI